MREEQPGPTPRWAACVLWAAAVYNILWGSFIVLFPLLPFQWAGIAPPNYPPIWQCVGMIVGVYGVGYACAAHDPLHHWPIVLVGLLGKILGPIGFVAAALRDELPWKFGFIIAGNDILWWIPFAFILYHAAAKSRLEPPESPSPRR